MVNTTASRTIKLHLTRLDSQRTVPCSNELDSAFLSGNWATTSLATRRQGQRAVDTHITSQHHATSALPHTIQEELGPVGEPLLAAEPSVHRLGGWSEAGGYATMSATVEPAPHQPAGCSNRSYGWTSPYETQVFSNYNTSCAPNPVNIDGQYGCQCNAEMVERQTAAYRQISAAPALSMDDDDAPTAHPFYASWTPHDNNMCERAMIQVHDLPSRMYVMRPHRRRRATHQYPYLIPQHPPPWRRRI